MLSLAKRWFVLFSVLLGLSPAAGAHPSHEQQLSLLNLQIAQFPDQQRLYIERGIAYSSDGELDPALADFNRAETLGDPLLVAFDLGVLYYRMGELQRARRYFDTTLNQLPDHSRSLEYRARIARDVGDYPAAVADFRAFFALRERPNPGHYISTAAMLAEMDLEGVDAALALLDEGMVKLGQVPQLQRYAIELERWQGNYDGAVERQQRLVAVLGDSPQWNWQMGQLLTEAGRKPQAVKYYRSAHQQLRNLRRTPARIELMQQLKVQLKPVGVDT